MLEYTEAFTSVSVYYDIIRLGKYKLKVANESAYTFQFAEAILRAIFATSELWVKRVREPYAFLSVMGAILARILPRWQPFITCRHSR